MGIRHSPASRRVGQWASNQLPNSQFKVIICIRLTTKGKMAKKSIHPQWYPEAKVICNGKVVMTVGSTKPELNVDVWSGNHPFYTGNQKIIDTEGRVERFLRKYGMFDQSASNQEDSQPEEQK
jgi:large subunit ribosomal protein L31